MTLDADTVYAVICELGEEAHTVRIFERLEARLQRPFPFEHLDTMLDSMVNAGSLERREVPIYDSRRNYSRRYYRPLLPLRKEEQRG